MKVEAKIYLVTGFIWLAIATDRLFFYPAADRVLSYVTLVIGLGFLGKFGWTKRRGQMW